MNRHERTKAMARDLVVSLALMIAAGVVLAALGPFGSFAQGSFVQRLGYWVPAALVGFCIFRPIVTIGDRIAAVLELPRMAAMVGAVLIAALPGALAMAWLNGALAGGLPPVGRLAPLYLNVAVVGALVTLLFLALEKPRSVAAAALPDEVQRPAPAFLERLPAEWQGRLVALEMEDHYVRAHGPDGRSTLLLMRMGDAERELGEADGLRVHRSWWVPRASVEGVRRDGRRMVLRLRGGLEAPVARDRAGAVRQAGWL